MTIEELEKVKFKFHSHMSMESSGLGTKDFSEDALWPDRILTLTMTKP